MHKEQDWTMPPKHPDCRCPMRRSGLLNTVVFLFTLCALSGAEVAAAAKLTVYVVNYPLKYFAERIAGGQATVVLPAPAGEDPAFWRPGVDEVLAYQQSDLILLNGANYAKWLQWTSLPRRNLVDTSLAFRDELVAEQDGVTHSHGPEGARAHGNSAITTWLDPRLAIQQAQAILDALTRRRPEDRASFEHNFAALKKDLLALDADIESLVAARTARPLLSSHPVYQYFARRYGLNIRSVHWEPDEAPGREQWAELATALRTHPAKWMIWEGAPLPETLARLKAMGIRSLVFDPAGNHPEEGDFLSVMRRNVENLHLAF